MFKIGDMVKINHKTLKHKSWYNNIKHLTGEYVVVDSGYQSVTFFTGEDLKPHPGVPNKPKGCRTWSTVHLLKSEYLIQENE